MIKKILLNYLQSHGFEVSKKQEKLKEIESYEAEIKTNIPIVKSHTMLNEARLISLWEQVEYCEQNKIKGAFVECGTWKGGAVGFMALANKKTSTERRHLHLFDAFTEICEPNPDVDGERAINEMKPFLKNKKITGALEPVKGVYDSKGGPGTLEENKNLLEKTIKYPAEYLHYHVGWFQNTLPVSAQEIGSIALLRLDGDYYDSTKVCLEHLYQYVVTGGVIIIDDYGAYDGCKKAVDEFIVNHHIKALLAHIDHDARFFVKTENK